MRFDQANQGSLAFAPILDFNEMLNWAHSMLGGRRRRLHDIGSNGLRRDKI
jgi:hypothetical protein